jgi:hypothetical protein
MLDLLVYLGKRPVKVDPAFFHRCVDAVHLFWPHRQNGLNYVGATDCALVLYANFEVISAAYGQVF